MGGHESPTHYVWRSMMARSFNPKCKAYSRYGAQGIVACKRWWKYENFLADMGERPDGLELERRDNDKGYSPSNCYWATRSAQQKNKSTTRRYTDDAFTGTLVECAAHVGISKELASWRWKNWGTFQKGRTWRELPSRKSKTPLNAG